MAWLCTMLWSHLGDTIYNTHASSRSGTVNQEHINTPDNKLHGANMGPTWVLSAPDGPHISPINLAIRDLSVFLGQHNVH